MMPRRRYSCLVIRCDSSSLMSPPVSPFCCGPARIPRHCLPSLDITAFLQDSTAQLWPAPSFKGGTMSFSRSIQQSLPITEKIPPLQMAEAIQAAAPTDRHPATVEAERVLRYLYNVVSRYDQRYPGLLSPEAKQAVLELRGPLIRHNLA